MSPSLVSLLLKVVGVSDGVVRQLQSVPGFAVQDFHPPAQSGLVPKPMPADIYLSTFIAAFLAVIEHGMQDAPAMCMYPVGKRKSLGNVERELRACLQFHRQTVEPYPSQVCDTLVLATNAGLDDAMHTLSLIHI